jgi:hypothetical protein
MWQPWELPEIRDEEEDPYAFEDFQQLGGELQEDDELLESFQNLQIEDQPTTTTDHKRKQGTKTTSSDQTPVRRSKRLKQPLKKLIDHFGEKLVRERGAGSRDFISNFFGILTTMARQTYYCGL